MVGNSVAVAVAVAVGGIGVGPTIGGIVSTRLYDVLTLAASEIR
jgi:hypothetical protein